MILSSFVWVQYQHVTDRQKDGIAVGNTSYVLSRVMKIMHIYVFRNKAENTLNNSRM